MLGGDLETIWRGHIYDQIVLIFNFMINCDLKYCRSWRDQEFLEINSKLVALTLSKVHRLGHRCKLRVGTCWDMLWKHLTEFKFVVKIVGELEGPCKGHF